jgi:catechol 2,3-dioxygenase-like lactoylglutathione lyase family enzyme
MEHFLLQTEDIEATKDWYVKVLGFRVGPSPDFKFPVYWLYLGDRDVLHITTGGKNVSENRKRYVGQQSDAATGTGVIDHIGFRTTGLEDMINHLNKLGVEFKERQVDDQGLYQLCSIRTASRSNSISPAARSGAASRSSPPRS